MSRIDDDIKKGTFSHTYLLYGTENYLKDNDCLKLRRALTNEGDTMNCTRFEGKDVSLKEILAQAETMPFFAERRLVEIHDSGLFKNAKESKDLQALIEFVKNPPETTVLVFCEEQTDARGKLYKAVQGSGTVIEYKSLKADTLSAWIAGLPARDVPLHISRFFPRFHMTDRRATSVRLIYHLADVARENLRYVYTGNC